MLPEKDVAHLESKKYSFEVVSEAGHLCLVIRDFPVPDGYDRANTDLLVRLPGGFPDAAPDMFWCDPPLRLASGGVPRAADANEPHLGRQWQRFSRHLEPGAWRPGVDSVGSYLALIVKDLERTALV